MAASAGVIGGAIAALTWGSMNRNRAFASRIRMSLRANAFLLNAEGGLGRCAPFVTAQLAAELVKGNFIVVPNFPHTISATGEPAIDNALAEPHVGPGALEGTVLADHILDRVPMDVCELLSLVPDEDGDGLYLVEAKLVLRLPAQVVCPGLTPATTTDMEAPIGTIFAFTWDSDTNVVLRPTEQMIPTVSSGGKTPGTNGATAGKRGHREGADGTTMGEQPKIFNGVMTDLDGALLFCVDKANFQKEEKRSRPCRRAMSVLRAKALLGDRGYILDEARVRRELQAAFSDPLGTDVPEWAKDLPDLTLAVCQLPAWKTPKLFTAFLQCDGNSLDPHIISLRHFLPPGVDYAEKELQPLLVALERCEQMLTYCWDGGFEGTTVALRARLSGGDLRRKEPKHLWYAAERAYVQFQKIMRAESGTQAVEPFKDRPPGAAVAVWVQCVATNFEPTFVNKIREEWSVIQTLMSAQVDDPETSAAAPSGKKTKVDPKAMCSPYAFQQLKVPNAKGCQDATCNRVHYDLGIMKRVEATALIKDHAGSHQMGRLLDAADVLLKE
jgi:hypothetical protein